MMMALPLASPVTAAHSGTISHRLTDGGADQHAFLRFSRRQLVISSWKLTQRRSASKTEPNAGAVAIIAVARKRVVPGCSVRVIVAVAVVVVSVDVTRTAGAPAASKLIAQRSIVSGSHLPTEALVNFDHFSMISPAISEWPVLDLRVA